MSDPGVPGLDLDVSTYPQLPRLRGIFVTGTDTEVGKTLVAGAIARRLRREVDRVEVFKPVASGCRRGRGGLISADGEFLAACAESRRTLAEITPVRYAAALAPNVAAERAHRPVDLEAIFEEVRRLADSDAEAVVVEGVGGLMCPLSDAFWVIHLAKLLALPMVIVARPGLGTINHTLLTLHAARTAGLEVAGVVINRYRIDPAAEAELSDPQTPYTRGDEDLAMFTNPAQIAERGRVDVLAIVPEDRESNVSDGRIGRDVQFAIDQVDWLRFL